MSEDSKSPIARVRFAHLLRGLAAGSVLVSHFGYTFWLKPSIVAGLVVIPSLPQFLSATAFHGITDFGIKDFWGHFGVALFFLVSGFVIPFSVATQSQGVFATSRIFRIWPTYVTGLVITILCIKFNSEHASVAFPYTTIEILKHILIVPRWPTLTRPIDGIIWTLEVEVFFYALCLLMMQRLRHFDQKIFLIGLLCVPAAIAVTALLPVLFRIGLGLYPLSHWASSMLQFISYMLIGTTFQYAFNKRIRMPNLIGLQLTLLAATTASWRLGVFSDQGWDGPLAYAIAYSVFGLVFVARGWIAGLRNTPLLLLEWIADISYPLYVVHGVLGYSILTYCTAAGWSPMPAVLLATFCVITVAVGLHLVVERPSQAFGKRLAHRSVPKPARI